MNHTPQIKRAIQFAARKHHGQFRRESEPLPYITHLFSVALLVAEDGADDDVVTAALLHDTIEDTSTTREEIATTFNERVATLVESVSEVKETGDKKLSWRERKEDYLARVKTASREAVLIAVADKVDNVESGNEELSRNRENFLNKWKRTPEEYLWFYREALDIAKARLPKHVLTKRLSDSYQIFARSFGSR